MENTEEKKPSFFKRFKKQKAQIEGINKEKMTAQEFFSRDNLNRYTIKAFLFGTNEKKGFLATLFIYILLILFGFVYLYPMLYMLAYSLMSQQDLVNPNVTYLPTSWYFENFTEAVEVLDYGKNLMNTLLVSLVPALLQTLCCSLAGYSLARYNYPGKRIIFGLIIFTFIVPPSLTMMPQLVLYVKLGLVNSVLSYYVPALFGQGIKSAVFILIFYQFFRAIPKSIIEASKIDGASAWKIFLKIAVPSAKSGFILAFLLSSVWYYNETVLAALYFGDAITTLPLQLENFESAYSAIFGSGGGVTGKTANEAVYMAGTLLNILPLLILYFCFQKYFVEGIDKAGITGE